MLLSNPETRHPRVPRLLLALLLLPLLVSSAVAISAQTEVRREAPTPPNPEATKDAANAGIRLFSSRLLSELYAEHGPGGFWDEGRARQMLWLARQSVQDGFNPEDFRSSEIERLIDEGRLTNAPGNQRTIADFLLSDALLRYLHHCRFGKYNPRKISRGFAFVEKADAAGLKADMGRVLASPDLAEELDALLPHPPFYENLKRGYQRYLAIADRGDREKIPVGANLSLGTLDPRVPVIRERLYVTDGFEDGPFANPQVYDENLAEAVKGFQKRSGLSADGVIGPNTIRALNRPIDDRLAKIRANLERMRWLYNDLPADYLFVDLTDYKLRLIRNQKEVWSTKVIVRRGRTRHVKLDEHLPVLIYYLTAVADDHGRVGLRRDLYARDKPLLAVLDEPAHGDRIAFAEPKSEPEPVSDPNDRTVSEQVITRSETNHPQSNRDAGDASTGDKTAKDGGPLVGANAPDERLEAQASAGSTHPLGEIGATTKEIPPQTAPAARSDGTPEQRSSSAFGVGIESPFQAEEFRLKAPQLFRRNAVGLGRRCIVTAAGRAPIGGPSSAMPMVLAAKVSVPRPILRFWSHRSDLVTPLRGVTCRPGARRRETRRG